MTPEPESKGNILLVDDIPDNLQLLSDLLDKLGYTVRSVTSGRMALKTVQVKPPDLILLDVKMPEMDGYQVCQALKINPDTCKIPVIFVSALDDVFDKVAAFECGGADYITKPFQIPEVVARLENQLTIQHQRRLLQAEVNKRREAEEVLYQSRALLSSVLNSSFDGIAALEAVRDPLTGGIEDFSCLVVNPVISRLLNQEREELVGKAGLRSLLSKVNPRIFSQLVAITETGTSLEGDLYYPIGDELWHHFSAVKLGDGFAVTIRDITARKQIEMELRDANQRLQELTEVDSLTQIPNRQSFFERLHQEWMCLAGEEQPLSLILVDVDDLKLHNDSYGHLLGDESLAKVAQAIKEAVGNPEYLVARYGGDEFTVLLPKLGLKEAIALAQTIQQIVHSLAIPQSRSTPREFLTVSLGVASQFPTLGAVADNLIFRANQAMIKAQHQGGDRYCTNLL